MIIKSRCTVMPGATVDILHMVSILILLFSTNSHVTFYGYGSPEFTKIGSQY